ncbi:MAG: Polyketide cyclase / dehydrase and lipid transport [Rhodobacteraceae bacterium HLUCCO07]|nr:MAG: Polyketide cyclase / dehydrase and lipid transport [Rhodobacteraceae bacterium HLUCCO07]
MIFTTKEDIEVPREHVFAAVSDFDRFERQALRRGAEISRLDVQTEPGLGMMWHIAFRFRGKRREIQIELVEYDPPNRMVFESRSPNVDGQMIVDLVALSPHRTRLRLEIELRPTTLAARLLVQSMKLAKGNLNKRFKIRVAEYAKATEESYRSRMA